MIVALSVSEESRQKLIEILLIAGAIVALVAVVLSGAEGI